MVFKGNDQIGKIAVGGSAVGKIFVGSDKVYESYDGPQFKDYAVGDVITMNYDGAPTDFIVIHQGNPDDTIYDDSCDGTWVMFANPILYSTTYPWKYLDSNVKSSIVGEIYNKFDAGIKRKIKTVKLPCQGSPVYNSADDTYSYPAYTMSDGISHNVFIPSFKEVGYTYASGDNLHDVGAKLDYFISGNGSSASAKRELHVTNADKDWLTRGYVTRYHVGVSSISWWAAIQTDASNNEQVLINNNSKSQYIRPAFIVNKKAKAIEVTT